MKALFIGGTGTISTAVSKLAVQRGWELYLLNRGNGAERIPEGARVFTADVNDELVVSELIKDMKFDVIADFTVRIPSQIERDIRLFAGKTKQFIFISSAAAYQKPPSYFKITESSLLSNPYWQYARDKITCEEILVSEYRKNGFPITIVRPSHTYDDRKFPLALPARNNGSWPIINRMLKGKPIIVHGDGSSLWTLTHNSDFAKGFVGLMGNRAAIGEAVHITTDESLTWNEIYDCIGNALNVKVNKFHVSTEFLVACQPDFEGPLFGDRSNTVFFDNSKIKRLVPDYIATMRFDQGARLIVENIMSHPELQVPDEEFDCFCDNIVKVQQEALLLFQKYNSVMNKN